MNKFIVFFYANSANIEEYNLLPALLSVGQMDSS